MRANGSIIVLLSAVVSLATAQDINSVPSCEIPCVDEMKGQFATLGCSGPTDTVCLCGKPAFKDGLKSCGKGRCEAASNPDPDQKLLLTYVDALCAAVAPAPVPVATPTPTPVASEPPAATTPPPAPATSSPAAVPVTTHTSSPQATPSPSSAGGAGQSSSQSSSRPTSSPTSSSASSSSSSTHGAGAAVGSSGKTGNSSEEGMSSAAKIGIGIGGGAAAVGLIGVLVCLLLHKRGKRRDQDRDSGVRSLTISDPMPGSGRSYAGDHHHEKYAVGMSDLEFKSRRYEDMVPRQVPRNMV